MTEIRQRGFDRGKTVWYYLSTPRLFFLVVLPALLIGVMVFGLGLYQAYRLWYPNTDPVSLYPFKRDLQDLDIEVVLPKRFIPEVQDYQLALKAKREGNSAAVTGSAVTEVRLTVTENATHIKLNDAVPVSVTWSLKPGDTVEESYPLTLLSIPSNHPPADLNVQATLDGRFVAQYTVRILLYDLRWWQWLLGAIGVIGTVLVALVRGWRKIVGSGDGDDKQ